MADELMSFEERILTKMADLVQQIPACRCTPKMAARPPTTTTTADPTVHRLEPAAPPPTTPATSDTTISSQVLVVGDSIMYASSKFGLQKLCNKTVTIQSNGGATPPTLTIPPISATATDVVVHVGTNSINGNNEQQTTPQSIADGISQRVWKHHRHKQGGDNLLFINHSAHRPSG